MNDIIILVQEEDYELIKMIKRMDSSVEELKDNNFDGDTTMLAFLISITPRIITELGEIVRTIIQNPSKGKIKINGVEIEGFTYEETMNFLDKIVSEDIKDKN